MKEIKRIETLIEQLQNELFLFDQISEELNNESSDNEDVKTKELLKKLDEELSEI